MIDGESRTSGIVLHKGPEGQSETGIWICTPGFWNCHVTRDEFCHFLLGRCTYTHESGEVIGALGVANGVAGSGIKQRIAGLRLVATDIEWEHGEGPEVRGTGEALLMTVCGRARLLDELTGEGVARLRAR